MSYEEMLKIYKNITEIIKKVAKEKKVQSEFARIVTSERPIIVSEKTLAWSHTVTVQITFDIESLLKIYVSCSEESKNKYTIFINPIIVIGRVEDSIEPKSTKISLNSDYNEIRKYIEHVFDSYNEKIEKVSSEIKEAESVALNKIIEILRSKLGVVPSLNIPIYTQYEVEENDKILRGHTYIPTTQYVLRVEFSYHINSRKFSIDKITIEDSNEMEDILASLLLPDITKNLFDSS